MIHRKRKKKGSVEPDYFTEDAQYNILYDIHSARGFHLGVQESIALRKALSYERKVPAKTIIALTSTMRAMLQSGKRPTHVEALATIRNYLRSLPFYRDDKTDELLIDIEGLVTHATWKTVKVLLLSIIEKECKIGPDFDGSDRSIIIELGKVIKRLEAI